MKCNRGQLMAISTNQKPTIYRNLYENTATVFLSYTSVTISVRIGRGYLFEESTISRVCTLKYYFYFDCIDPMAYNK